MVLRLLSELPEGVLSALAARGSAPIVVDVTLRVTQVAARQCAEAICGQAVQVGEHQDGALIASLDALRREWCGSLRSEDDDGQSPRRAQRGREERKAAGAIADWNR